jgi:phosphoglycolate phosphatase-like HAD superfamily hydrolase
MPHGTRDLSFDDVDGDLVLLGLVGLIDPPREEAIAAVEECRRAGIEVKMITGDHAATASAIAEQLGLGGSGEVVTGRGAGARRSRPSRRPGPLNADGVRPRQSRAQAADRRSAAGRAAQWSP